MAMWALAVPSGSTAQPFDPPAQADFVAALGWWGVTSFPNCSSLTMEMVPPGSLGAAAGKATQPAGTPVPCHLWIIEGMPQCEEQGVLDHEVGHLLGYGHSPDPGSIMNPDEHLLCEQEEVQEARAIFARRIAAERRHYRRFVRHCRLLLANDRRHRCWTGAHWVRETLRETIEEVPEPVVIHR
jgi:hypothetical protein